MLCPRILQISGTLSYLVRKTRPVPDIIYPRTWLFCRALVHGIEDAIASLYVVLQNMQGGESIWTIFDVPTHVVSAMTMPNACKP